MRRVTARRVSRRDVLAGVAGSFALAGCVQRRSEYDGNPGQVGGPGGDGELSGEIGIAGSSTVYPLTEAVRVEFLEEHPGVSMSLQSTGTGGGFGSFFCTGDRVINNASRPVEESELEQCGEAGIEPLEFRVATDALTVVVNNDADWVDCLTVDELRQIWRPDGAQTWSDVREEWPDEPLELYGPAPTSGTFDYFTEAIVGEADQHREDYQETEDDNTIVTGVSGSQYAMGYLGFSYYSGNSEAVKAVAVEDPETDAGCVEPSLETASTGQYTPLARPLFIYVAKEALAEEHVAAFVRFYLEQATNEQLVADSVGYVPLNDEQQAYQLGRLEQALIDLEASDA